MFKIYPISSYMCYSYICNTVQRKIVAGENFGEFGEMHIIRQYFTQPNSRLLKVATVSYCKFANIFLTKSSETIDLPKFSPATILHYTVLQLARKARIELAIATSWNLQ